MAFKCHLPERHTTPYSRKRTKGLSSLHKMSTENSRLCNSNKVFRGVYRIETNGRLLPKNYLPPK